MKEVKTSRAVLILFLCLSPFSLRTMDEDPIKSLPEAASAQTEDSCPICLESIDRAGVAIYKCVSCTGLCHTSCLTGWLIAQPLRTCPLCRYNFPGPVSVEDELICVLNGVTATKRDELSGRSDVVGRFETNYEEFIIALNVLMEDSVDEPFDKEHVISCLSPDIKRIVHYFIASAQGDISKIRYVERFADQEVRLGLFTRLSINRVAHSLPCKNILRKLRSAKGRSFRGDIPL